MPAARAARDMLIAEKKDTFKVAKYITPSLEMSHAYTTHTSHSFFIQSVSVRSMLNPNARGE